jgi:hypothetical protein
LGQREKPRKLEKVRQVNIQYQAVAGNLKMKEHRLQRHTIP